MEWMEAVLLGVVQGLTEFLPVSSSGHLVLFQHFLGFEEHDLAFNVASHMGTLLSVITVYFYVLRRMTVETIKFPVHRQVNTESRLVGLVILGTIPTAIIGLSLKDTFEALFSNLLAVGVCLCLTGVLLFLTKLRSGGQMNGVKFDSLESANMMTIRHALIIGVAQGLAIAPGISRSGTTIAVALFLGLPRHTAAMFSFMLAIPAILGAGLLELKDVEWSPDVMTSLGLGFFVSYLAGLVGLLTVLSFVKKGRLEVFSLYLWAVGGSVIIWSLFF